MANIPRIMLLISPSTAYSRSIILGIGRYAEIHGPWEFYRQAPFYRQADEFRPMRSFIEEWRPDGIIGYVRNHKHAEELIPPNLPAILLFTEEQPRDFPIIVADESSVAKMAAEHLLERGFRNFAFCGFNNMWWSRLSCDFFCERIANAGFQTHVYRCPKEKTGRTSEESTYIKSWLVGLPKPVGLFACNDDRAQDVLEACKSARLKVPEQVAVLGADNDEFICQFSGPPLSSVALEAQKAGFEAAKLLDKMISGKKTKKSIIHVRPTHVVTRQSTDTLAINDGEVVKALRFIRSHAEQPIRVGMVVEHVNLARRRLEMRFKGAVGHTVHKEIRKVRSREIARMLVNTDMSVSSIAQELGFISGEHISRFFKKEFKTTPQAYRRKLNGRLIENEYLCCV